MELQETFNNIRTQYSEQLGSLQKSVIAGICSFIYPIYLSNIIQKPQKEGIKILVPSLKKVQTFLAKNSNFIQMISKKLIDDIVNNNSIMLCIDYPELSLFDPKKVNIDVLKVIFDMNIIETIPEVIIRILAENFKLYDKNQKSIIENNETECLNEDLLNNEALLTKAYTFILEQIVYHLIIDSKSFLTDKNTNIEFKEKNTNIILDKNYLVAIRNKNMPCDIYFSPLTYISEFYDKISWVTNTTITTQHTDDESNDKIILNTGVFNQVYVFKNSDSIFFNDIFSRSI